ncbi:hypothetical protein HK104_005985 [Borealophlyctis nickersoniae]|nr:hypothetical protein HK104_005985 [Borealophlyctis nickersoniae]
MEVIEAAFEVGRWSVGRFHRVITEVREPVRAAKLPEQLGWLLASLHWAYVSHGASEEGIDNETADGEVWERYAIGVQGKSGPTPIGTDPESVMELVNMREGAVAHFKRETMSTLRKLDSVELGAVMCHITRYGTAPKMLELVLPLAMKRISEASLVKDIVPRFMVLAVLQPDLEGSSLLNTLMSQAKDFISIEAANSALEYCAHLQRSNCCRAILDGLGHLVRPEGLVAALIPASARGSEHLLAILELFVMDQCQQAMERKLNRERGRDDAGGMSSLSALSPPPLPASRTVTIESPCEADYGEMVAPCVYMLLVLAAAGGYAKPNTVKELIEFYRDPCQSLIGNRVRETFHARFIKDLFNLVCQLNHVGTSWTLIECGWSPPSIQSALYQAIQLGHQSMVHVLLDSLLLPDTLLEPPSGIIPLVFRKTECLTLLPMVARRFPTEAEWFIEQISCIPIPPCVPRTPQSEPDLRPRAVSGVRIGLCKLSLLLQRTVNAPSIIWNKLQDSGQFRRAGTISHSAGGEALETESLVCMAPLALLDSQAVHDTVGGRFFNPSSPFIRLLATGEESIILQPVMQALMEYHWIRGRFWLRYALQLFFSLLFVVLAWAVFVLVAQRQNPAAVTTVGSEQYDIDTLRPLGVIVLALSLAFMVQELRQFLDEPRNYISPSNAVDILIHFTVMYSVIQGAFRYSYVPPLLMSFTLILCACRFLLHLRIIPSVGPIVRIWVTAIFNIFPIFVPMMIMAVSFAGAFYLVQTPMVAPGVIYTGHFGGFKASLQSVLTMAGGDYR